MKIFLCAINSKYIHSNLAVYSLKEYAKTSGADIEIGEYTINNQKDDILKAIHKAKADVMCFSVYIWNLEYVIDISKEFHKINPNVPIWVGGPEVSYETEDFLRKNPQIYGALLGEGEETFKELCLYYEDLAQRKHNDGLTDTTIIDCTNEPQGVNGLLYRGYDGFIKTGFREAMNLDDIPFPYGNMKDFENRIIYYESSRGCPFMCSYCLSSIDKGVRFRSLDLIYKELKFFLDNKVPQVKFVDRTFNINPARTEKLLQFILDNDNGFTNFHFEVAADILTDKEMDIMSRMRQGLIQLEIGVQSTNTSTISEIHRSMNLDKLWSNVKRIQSFKNIHQHLDLIAGLPFEDYQTFKKSFNDLYSIYPDQLQLGFLKVLKGSYMYEHAKEYEAIWHEKPQYEIMSTKWISYDEILKLKNIEDILEVYYNSGQFPTSIRLLEKCFNTPFDMYEAFGDFYEDKGYFNMSHSRNRRAEILLEFVENIRLYNAEFGSNLAPSALRLLDIIKEALTFDLYYRENCKSRPSFAKDMKKWSEESRKYCTNGKMNHLEKFTTPLPLFSEEVKGEYYILFDYTNRNNLRIID